MTLSVIPLQSVAQTFSISLNAVTYNIRTFWNSQAQGWFMDISDANQNLLIGGLPFTTGDDLLSQFAYLGIGGELYVGTPGNPLAAPTQTNLGTGSKLYFVT
jgi:hypothetical protein